MSQQSDYAYMARALQLARRGLYTTDPNPRVGCVLVKQGRVIGEGFHARAGEGHAEVNALRHATEAVNGATAYITLEPCCHHGRTPPCTQALIEAGVGRVVIGMRDPNPLVSGKGVNLMREQDIIVDEGVMTHEAELLNPGYISRMRHNRPWIRVKSAMSLDGRTAMASGESQWISGDAARRDVQLLRARSSAVMTGIGTVLADDPSLNVRLSAHDLAIEGEARQPVRVVLDAGLKIDSQARLLTLPGQCIIFTASTNKERIAQVRESGAAIVTVEQNDKHLDLAIIMQVLAEHEMNELHVEAGSRLVGALFNAGLVDEFIVYVAPHLMGDAAQGLVHLPGLDCMEKRLALKLSDVRMLGDDVRITASPKITA